MGHYKYSKPGLPMKGLFRVLGSPYLDLGPLEQQILSVLWRRGSATVYEVIEYGDIPRAYTTVMTTLNRLCKKRLLSRMQEPRGRAFRYKPRHTQAELEQEVASETVRNLLGLNTNASLPLSYLVEAISNHDVRLLDDLQCLLDEKRRELRGQVPATRN